MTQKEFMSKDHYSTLPIMPETMTVSTRLTLGDYLVFRRTCAGLGWSMHAVLRLMISAFLLRIGEQIGENPPISHPLEAAYRKDLRRKKRILPRNW